MKRKKVPVRLHHLGSPFTCAMFPAASALLTIFVFTEDRSYEYAAFYCLLFATIAAPVVYFSGVYDWNTRFLARHTTTFDHKLFFGALFVILSIGLISTRILFPDILLERGLSKWIYILAVYAATVVVTYLGHLGSKFTI